MAGSQAQKQLRYVVIGAGVSGILIAVKLREAFGPGVDIYIFEKNNDVGGTWFENRYPGCACDVPSHIYQYSFCPNPAWSSFYASSSEIQAYLKAVTKHYDVDRYISFESEVRAAVWDDHRGLWTIHVRDQDTVEAEVLFNATGILNNIKYPRLKDLDKFSGPLLHTANWDPKTNLTGKRVAVIGSGASAIQTLPAIQGTAAHVDIYIRTPSWIIPPVGQLASRERKLIYSTSEKDSFREDVDTYTRMCKDMETSFNSMFKMFIKDSIEQHDKRSEIEGWMKQRIRDPDLQARLIPSFEVGCKRLNPGEAYLEALQQPNVTPIFEPVERVTDRGIISQGQERKTDVIIAATGFDTSFIPRFPITGKKGADLGDIWTKNLSSYFGVAVSGFPNYLIFLGPNTPISNGSLMGSLEATADYFVRLLKKFVREECFSFDVRPEVQADFDSHTQELMQKMVWTGSCQSWYKTAAGKVSALWPGSSLHYRQVLEENRWEDFEWRHRGNRFAHWGQGISNIETLPKDNEVDLAYYIKAHEPLPLAALQLSSSHPRDLTERIYTRINTGLRAGRPTNEELHSKEAESNLIDIPVEAVTV